MSGSGGEEWGPGSKDRQQATFSQPEQSYEAAFNKVWRSGSFGPRETFHTSNKSDPRSAFDDPDILGQNFFDLIYE